MSKQPEPDALNKPLVDLVLPIFEETISTFEDLTGLDIIILFKQDYTSHLKQKNYVLLKRHGHNNPFCALIKSSLLHKVCMQHEYHVRIPNAECLCGPLVDECPFGAIEIAVPFFVQGKPVATLFCGQATQFRRRKEWETFILKKTRGKGIEAAVLKNLYTRFLHTSRAEMLRYGNLLFHALSDLAGLMDDAALERTVRLRQNPIIHKAVRYITEASGEYPSETQVAEALGRNPQYFSRLFKKVVGQRFVDFQTEFRISRAQRLLQNTNLPVISIALEVGYSRHSYFAKKFRGITGMTPREYRKARQSYPIKRRGKG